MHFQVVGLHLALGKSSSFILRAHVGVCLHAHGTLLGVAFLWARLGRGIGRGCWSDCLLFACHSCRMVYWDFLSGWALLQFADESFVHTCLSGSLDSTSPLFGFVGKRPLASHVGL